MPSKCFASWASPNWTRPPRRRDKNRSCSDQPQNPPPYLLGVTGHNVKHALARVGTSNRDKASLQSAEIAAISCLEVINGQSSLRPLSFQSTCLRFASTTEVER